MKENDKIQELSIIENLFQKSIIDQKTDELNSKILSVLHKDSTLLPTLDKYISKELYYKMLIIAHKSKSHYISRMLLMENISHNLNDFIVKMLKKNPKNNNFTIKGVNISPIPYTDQYGDPSYIYLKQGDHIDIEVFINFITMNQKCPVEILSKSLYILKISSREYSLCFPSFKIKELIKRIENHPDYSIAGEILIAIQKA